MTLHQKSDAQLKLLENSMAKHGAPRAAAVWKPKMQGCGMEVRRAACHVEAGHGPEHSLADHRPDARVSVRRGSLRLSWEMRLPSGELGTRTEARRSVMRAHSSLQSMLGSTKKQGSSEWRSALAALAGVAARSDEAMSDIGSDAPARSGEVSPTAEASMVRSATDGPSGSCRLGDPQLADSAARSQRVRQPSRRRRLWQFLEDASSSRPAYVYSNLSVIAIIAGVCLATLASLMPGEGDNLVLVCIEAPFVLELIVRFSACPNRHILWLDTYNLLDLASFLASFVPRSLGRLGYVDLEMLRSIMVFSPFFFLLRLLRRFDHLQLLASAFGAAVQAFPVLMYTLLLVALLHAAALFVVEPRTAIPTVQDSLWFTVLTIFTMSFGDLIPVTPVGRALAGALILLSCLYTAIPIGIVGNAFSKVWEDRERLLAMQHMRRRTARAGYTLRDLALVFESIDEDQDGQLTIEEFRHFFEVMDISVTDTTAALVFETFDDSGGGSVDFAELMFGLFLEQRFYVAAIGRASAALEGP